MKNISMKLNNGEWIEECRVRNTTPIIDVNYNKFKTPEDFFNKYFDLIAYILNSNMNEDALLKLPNTDRDGSFRFVIESDMLKTEKAYNVKLINRHNQIVAEIYFSGQSSIVLEPDVNFISKSDFSMEFDEGFGSIAVCDNTIFYEGIAFNEAYYFKEFQNLHAS